MTNRSETFGISIYLHPIIFRFFSYLFLFIRLASRKQCFSNYICAFMIELAFISFLLQEIASSICMTSSASE
ncbi:MAG: hypothetical protein EBT90_07960 [Rhodobacteraceae bacterium]|nr:hypothetical protein [Paracoccaceae bacterium]